MHHASIHIFIYCFMYSSNSSRRCRCLLPLHVLVLQESEGSFAKVYDAGRKLDLHQIHGFLPTKARRVTCRLISSPSPSPSLSLSLFLSFSVGAWCWGRVGGS
jgi:hypothetical protein